MTEQEIKHEITRILKDVLKKKDDNNILYDDLTINQKRWEEEQEKILELAKIGLEILVINAQKNILNKIKNTLIENGRDNNEQTNS